ncbi:MAG: hypothetical protein II696_07340, partial [Firmicutes bacterium]|nr:hypothetical protein [Bacillota bacterium]
IIEKNNDPAIRVNNQKGWGLTVEKNWTDATFMQRHDPVYFAVYVEKTAAGGGEPTYELLDGTVRELKAPNTSVYYFFDNLQAGTPFSDYTVFEVEPKGNYEVDNEGKVTGYSHLKRIEEGGDLHVKGVPVGGSDEHNYKYTVSYDKGEQTDQNENIRTDTTTNSRPGIKILKTDMEGNALKNAVFTLKYKGGLHDGEDVAAESYKSDENGLVTVAYVSEGEYTLAETKAPKGYVAPDGPLTITVDENGDVTVTPTVAGDAELFDIQAGSGSGSSGSSGGSMKATITVKNRTTSLTAFKKDAVTGDPVSGVHFALYRQVKDNEGHLVKDYDPISGFEDLVTDENGVIPKIDMDLNPGTYYLTETQAAARYAKLMEDLCFTIGADGTVVINSEGHSGWLTAEESGSGQGGTKAVAYAITVPNSRTSNVQILKTDPNGQTISTGASFALYTASDYDDESEQPKSGAKAIVTGRTGTDGILSLGDLPVGEYRLVETEAPAGYYKADSAIKIYVTAGTSEAADNTVTAMQANQPSVVTKISAQGEDTWQIRVWNNPGAELPASGGPGTKWMYLLGSLLTLAAGIALVSRRRFLVR